MTRRPILALARAALGLAALALWLVGPARADSWAPPETKVTLSANGQFRFTVEPASRDHPRDYFEEEVEAQRSGIPVVRPAPMGLLERRDPRGRWQPVWAAPLVNPIAPVTALVADDGRHVATFDNWHSVGHGAHVIVIYGPDGALVRSLTLADLVPEDYIEALPRSVSSIFWSRDEGFSADGASLVIPVVVPHGGGLGDDAETVPFTIALADGAVTLPRAAQWERALAASARVTAQMRAYEAEQIAYLTAPLQVPQGCEASDWHEYLSEAFARLSPEPPFVGSTATKVLFPRDHPRHRESLKWLREEVADVWDFPTNAAFAAPCDPEALVAAFAGAVKRVKPGAASQATYYIAAPAPQFAAIARLVAPTGAKTVWLDPAAAIPQRPGRIPGTPEHEAALEAYWNAQAAEMPDD